jgi:hypothetical protein
MKLYNFHSDNPDRYSKLCNSGLCFELVKKCRYGWLFKPENGAKTPEFRCKCTRDCAECKIGNVDAKKTGVWIYTHPELRPVEVEIAEAGKNVA